MRIMKKLILASVLAALSATTLAADYYVVVPLTKRVAVENIAVALNAATIPGGMVGSTYAGFNFNSALVVTGDPAFSSSGVAWSLVSGALPAGLALSADGKLTGLPTTAGTANFQLQASYKTKSGKQAYQVVVGDLVVALAAATPTAGVQGVAYFYDIKPNLSVNGGSDYPAGGVTWSISSGALPAGLRLNTDGSISGTPTTVGTSRVEFTARYLGKPALRAYDLVVKALKPNLQLDGTPAATQTFGTVDVASPATPIAFSIVNSGAAAGSLTLPAFGGANPTEFSATSNCTNVAPDAKCVVTVGFSPQGSGSRSANLLIAGSTVTFTGTGQPAPATFYVVLTTGASYRIPAGVTSITAWAAGGGGGGAGSTSSDGTSGGGGGAGGLTWSTFAVEPGSTLSYAIGAGGAPGYNTGNGYAGGRTTVTYGTIALAANGGMGGYYNSNSAAAGGTWSGGLSGVAGGTGRGSSGDAGGGGGGAVGGASGAASSAYGGSGGTAAFPGGLAEAFAAAGIQTGKLGGGGASGSGSTTNVNHGYGGTGYGHGGGGAGYYGGHGAPGALGGGGGGAAGYNGLQYGGIGGSGFIVLQLN
jgi:hypothetical protein